MISAIIVLVVCGFVLGMLFGTALERYRFLRREIWPLIKALEKDIKAAQNVLVEPDINNIVKHN